MFDATRNIIIKEIREMLRDPRIMLGMIVVPLIIFPIMGMAMSTASTSMMSSLDEIRIGYANNDAGYNASGANVNVSAGLIAFLSMNKTINLTDIGGSGINGIMANGTYAGYDAVMVIPANFSSEIMANRSSNVELYTFMNNFGISESLPANQIAGLITVFSKVVAYQTLNDTYNGNLTNNTAPRNISALLDPVGVLDRSVVKGKVVEQPPMAIANAILLQSMMSPIIIIIVIMMSSQLVAMSVAMEKEDKTLETLLTLPVSRFSILAGKLGSGIFVAGLACVSYMIGFMYYMDSLTGISGTGGGGVSLSEIGISATPLGNALLVITLFLSIIAAMSIAVLLAAFTEDVRSAQSLIGVIYVPVFVPALIMMFAPVESLDALTRSIIYAIPFSYPALAARAMYTADYAIVMIGIVYQLIFTFLMIYIAARFINSEKILTAKLVLKKKEKIRDLSE